jgi:heme-degrading monooxygenase HmoA
VIRALVLYDSEPDPARYAKHVELCRRVPGATFRHGRVFAAPTGEPQHRYYAEFEWPDMDAFKQGARSEEFLATGKDGMELGVRFTVEFAEVDD